MKMDIEKNLDCICFYRIRKYQAQKKLKCIIFLKGS